MENCILDVPVLDVAIEAYGIQKDQVPLPYNFKIPWLFHAKAWDVTAKKSTGDALGFFMPNGTKVEAEIAWKDGPPTGTASVETGIAATVYSEAGYAERNKAAVGSV
jgi:hypothetical protein